MQWQLCNALTHDTRALQWQRHTKRVNSAARNLLHSHDYQRLFRKKKLILKRRTSFLMCQQPYKRKLLRKLAFHYLQTFEFISIQVSTAPKFFLFLFPSVKNCWYIKRCSICDVQCFSWLYLTIDIAVKTLVTCNSPGLNPFILFAMLSVFVKN